MVWFWFTKSHFQKAGVSEKMLYIDIFFNIYLYKQDYIISQLKVVFQFGILYVCHAVLYLSAHIKFDLHAYGCASKVEEIS